MILRFAIWSNKNSSSWGAKMPSPRQEIVSLWPESLDGCNSNFAFRTESIAGGIVCLTVELEQVGFGFASWRNSLKRRWDRKLTENSSSQAGERLGLLDPKTLGRMNEPKWSHQWASGSWLANNCRKHFMPCTSSPKNRLFLTSLVGESAVQILEFPHCFGNVSNKVHSLVCPCFGWFGNVPCWNLWERLSFKKWCRCGWSRPRFSKASKKLLQHSVLYLCRKTLAATKRSYSIHCLNWPLALCWNSPR